MQPKWKLVGVEADAELTSEQAALVAGLKPAALIVMRCQGRGPAFERKGRRIVYRLAPIES